MATRQAIAAGATGPIYVNETQTAEAIAPVVYINETASQPSPPAPPQTGIGWFDSEW